MKNITLKLTPKSSMMKDKQDKNISFMNVLSTQSSISKVSGESPSQVKESIKQIEQIQKNKWSTTQQILFCKFWLKKFMTCQNQTFSFYRPLKRTNVFSELSNYMDKQIRSRKEGQVIVIKDKHQCKTRFWTIRKKFQRNRVKNEKVITFDFVDYIERKSQSLLTMKQQEQDLKNHLNDFYEMKNDKSELMLLTKQLANFEKKETESLQQEVLLYFKQNKLDMSILKKQKVSAKKQELL